MSNNSAYRGKFTRVKTAKGRKKSSTEWLKRQLNDPFTHMSKMDGYKSRAAYKILEIQEKFKIFNKDDNVIDLGAAPGSWSQVVSDIIKANEVSDNKVIAIDLLEMDELPGVHNLQADFNLNSTKEDIKNILGDKKVDVVVSDMAANATGHKVTDHLRIIDLCEQAILFSVDVLKEGGHFVAKIFQGGLENDLLEYTKKKFKIVKHFKPKSSRSGSSEMYLIAMYLK